MTRARQGQAPADVARADLRAGGRTARTAGGAARALFAAGFRAGDIVHNSFSYHLTPGGFILESGAHALGCAVIPGGTGNTEQQLEAIAHLRPTGYIGTPDFLKILLDSRGEVRQGRLVDQARAGLRRGAAALAAAGTGRRAASRCCNATPPPTSASSPTRATRSEGMIVNETLIVEIVRPGTGDPVPEGEVGEVVVTSFNPDYPMIRLATGDLSAVLPGASPCGRTNMRINGWMGRADQTTKVKGMFVHPEQIAEVGKRHPELGRLRLVRHARGRAGRHDAASPNAPRPTPGLAEAVAATLAVGDQAQGRGQAGRAGNAAERRQGDRRRASGGIASLGLRQAASRFRRLSWPPPHAVDRPARDRVDVVAGKREAVLFVEVDGSRVVGIDVQHKLLGRQPCCASASRVSASPPPQHSGATTI